MADPPLIWGDLSNIASTAQLTGVDFVKVIHLVIQAAKNPRILKKRCRLFGQHLEHVRNLLQIIMPAELMEDTRIREPLKRLENAIMAAYVPVDICQKRSKFYLYTSGCYIAKCLKEAQVEVDDCLKIIPLLVLAAMQQQERRANAREDEEWKKNIAAQMAAIQSFTFKQLLDEACKDITDKTNYDDFAKKWGHDERFKVLGHKERVSLFNERVSLRKTLKEKVKAGQVAPININSFSYWPEGNPSNVPLLVGEVLDDGVPEDFIEDLIMPVRDSLPVEQLDEGNPSNLPLLVGELLDDGVPDYFIEGLITSAGDSLPVEQLFKEYKKRNRLSLLKNILEHLVREGSQDVHVHSALGKIRIDTNDKPEHFLETNLYYDSYVVGKHCEENDPTLAVASYWRGQCDNELIDVTNKNFLFELQARYVVERADPQLWKRVLDVEKPHRRELIDLVASTVLPESKNSDQVSATVKAFINADCPHELIELLEKIVLQNSTFSGNPNLQDLLIHTAIEADRSRLMGYINRLDNFDGPAIGEIAIGKKLYEEAFNIFKKFNLNVQAVNVLLDHIRSFERAYQFASRVKKDVVWSQVAKAQLREGLLSDAIESFIRADDATQFPDVIRVAEEASLYHDLVEYLFMVKKNVKEPKVHTELNAKLASAFVKLRQFQKAFDAARNVNCLKTWKEVCFACVDAEEFRLARLCGFNIIVQEDGLEEVSEYYQKKGRINELISLMEDGLRLDSWHTSLKELHILYAKYRPDKLKEHIALF